MLKCRNVLVLSPHTDDSELGAGGLISRLISGGARVTVVVFCNAAKSLAPDLLIQSTSRNDNLLLQEFKAAAALQQVNTVVLNYPVREFPAHRQEILDNIYALAHYNGWSIYDLVLTPCGFDTHQDHQVIYAEACRAFRRVTLLGYELPWNHVNLANPLYVRLPDDHMNKKWAAISCYQSQVKMNRAYFNKDFIYGWARVRGVQAGSEYAEAFQVVHGVV